MPRSPAGPVSGPGQPLVCPVNLSEGRRLEVVRAIGRAAVDAGAALLDVHTDPDHNRSVLTLAGLPETLVNGLLALTAEAVATIDLASHRGVHPRMGAVDVVPLVPVQPDAMGEAVLAARTFARRSWVELGIPTFLYENATPAGPPRSLPDVRRRGWHDLAPDVGGPGAHPTGGAMAVGARGVLVALNVDLATADTGVAQRIAAAIRERDGGLAHVRALGLFLASRGTAQVSMNLVRPDVTPIGPVFEAVSVLAAGAGVGVVGGEVVGLTPRSALPARSPLVWRRQPKILEDELARWFGPATSSSPAPS